MYVSATLNFIRELLGFPYSGGFRILRKDCPPNQRNKVITIEYFPTIVCVVTFKTSESEADNYVRTSYHCSETELQQEASLANFALPTAGLSGSCVMVQTFVMVLLVVKPLVIASRCNP